MNKKQREKMVNIILILIAIALIISNIILLIKFQNDETYVEEENYGNNQTIENETKAETEEQNIQEDDITTMTEQQRMKYYMNSFLEKIENDNYKEAYDLLNQQFKETYFPTEESFKNYSEKYFDMSTTAVEFNNIERLGNPTTGNIYVLWIYLVDVLKNTPDEEKEETNFVILEKDYNQYELSFNVKE